MFDFGFSELMVIGAVALVVLGPEKLPVVARTAGEWLGKAQRLVAQVKSDIEREAELSELKKIQEEAKSVADDITKTVKGEADAIEGEMKSLERDVNDVAKTAEDGFKSATESSTDATAEAAEPEPKYKELTDDEPNPAFANVGGESSTAADDFYSWYGDDPNNNSTSHVFEKRYKPGPSIDELAEQLERLKAEIGDRSPQLGGGSRRYASRARSNRVRIYR